MRARVYICLDRDQIADKLCLTSLPLSDELMGWKLFATLSRRCEVEQKRRMKKKKKKEENKEGVNK